ncbi:hypothetical protein BEN35_00410 [Streptomyces fradiae]|nr:hypothetical protein BEN35_00410 [Streptomyces fradiae]
MGPGRGRGRGLSAPVSSRAAVPLGDRLGDLRRAGGLLGREAFGVQLLGQLLVLGHQQIEVGVAELEDAQVEVGALEAFAPQADVLDTRHDPAEQQLPEEVQELRLLGVLRRLRRRDAEVLQHLGAAQPVAHEVAALDDELLAFAEFGVGELPVVVAQRHPPEGHVPGLVLHDVGEDLLRERLVGGVADHAERGQGQALDQDLHPEVGHVPAGVAQGVAQQGLEVVVDRVEHPDLLVEEAAVDLGVPGLVHGLGRGVELGVQVGDGLHDAGGADHGALLAVEELAELPGAVVPPQLALVAFGHPAPVPGAVEGEGLVGGAERVVGVHLQVPVDAADRVPLLVLALLVQGEQPVAPVVVVPAEAGGAGGRHLPVGGSRVFRVEIVRRHRRLLGLGLADSRGERDGWQAHTVSVAGSTGLQQVFARGLTFLLTRSLIKGYRG